MEKVTITLEVTVHDKALLREAANSALESRGADYSVDADDLGPQVIEAILYDDSGQSYDERGFEMTSVESVW
jgi:hypothetical protein